MRFGISCTHRRKIWFVASGGCALLTEVGNTYEIVKECALETESCPEIFFGSIIAGFGFLSPEAQASLIEFLHVLSVSHMEVSFSPLIYIVSRLLLLFWNLLLLI
jgi:hypothetical protein